MLLSCLRAFIFKNKNRISNWPSVQIAPPLTAFEPKIPAKSQPHSTVSVQLGLSIALCFNFCDTYWIELLLDVLLLNHFSEERQGWGSTQAAANKEQ
jgi:hypothetical protein